MELRELRGFVAVVEEGGLSAAARRLHVSQPAVSQTVAALERQLGVPLLVRSSTGVKPTDAGRTLLAEARAVLARHDEAVATMARHLADGAEALRIGVPLELPVGLLSGPLAALRDAHPATRTQLRHLSTAAQRDALRAGELDLGLLRERPSGRQLDAALVLEEPLGVLLAAEQAPAVAGPGGVRLDALAGMDWIGFPRSGSPAWYDEIAAVMRSHGLDPAARAPEGQSLIPEVKVAAVSAGGAFAFAPPGWPVPVPATVTWSPLVGSPLVRRTWAAWRADSHRRDLGRLVAALPAP
ncbi:LysR family transcriptional regulator [Pseudonocardia zijingensis]|jgi:DNA-binding transcriptional LysR family regulator|uniref:LysR family transcriptional regulator n=1 Tax=Pseudonocardia zijingensis TaxID=153376 RepID=A0ABN1QY96_9PSEU